MNNLFHIPDYKIDTSKFGHLLHDKVVNDFEEEFKQFAPSANLQFVKDIVKPIKGIQNTLHEEHLLFFRKNENN